MSEGLGREATAKNSAETPPVGAKSPGPLPASQPELASLMAARPEVQIVRLRTAADLPLPVYATKGAAGADLHAALPEGRSITVAMGEIHLIPTGLSIAIPNGFEGQIRPRSGLALREGLTIVNAPGTIDCDYRGELKIVVTCMKSTPCTIQRGDRIAQLVIAPVTQVAWIEVSELSSSTADNGRGTQGFGHTGRAQKAQDA